MKNILLPILIFLMSWPLSGQELISSEFKGSRTLAQMQAEFSFLMQNGIEMYKITYTTPDVFGQLDTASGLVLLPIREEEYAYPLVCVEHGTVGSKTDVPSNLQGGWELAAVFSGLGYVASAPDFLGLGESRGFHPYVHADSEASASIDMLFAVQDFVAEQDMFLNDQLFITGYSQGGHAAAATHKVIQEEYTDDFTVTASAPMSGPYSVSGEMLDRFLSDEPYYFPGYFPYTALSYDLVYDIFEEIEDVFKSPYSIAIQKFRDGEFSLGTMNGVLISQLETLNGEAIPRFMLQDSILEILQQEEADHPFFDALLENDLYNWVPEAPTRFIYCMADDQVIYRNSIVADSVMNELGAPAVESVDVNSNFDHGQCVEPAVINASFFFGQFQMLEVVSTVENAMLSIEAYPNPVRETLLVKNLPAKGDIQLINFKGDIVHVSPVKDSNTEIPVNHLSPGVYLLKVISGAEEWQKKIVVY